MDALGTLAAAGWSRGATRRPGQNGRSFSSRLAFVMILTAAFLVTLAAAARAQPSGERIEEYSVNIIVEKTGELSITETIAYDFGPNERHGIFRNIPYRFHYDERFDRIYPLEVLSVTGSPGTPAEYEIEDVEGHRRIRIGDPERTITGRHVYTLAYKIEGALNGFPGHDEVYWNAIGAEWPVPIGEARATVIAPAAITRVACFSGPHQSSLLCDEASFEGDTARFSGKQLLPRQGLTVVVGLPKGVVPDPQPILKERWSAARAFEPSRPAVLGSLGLSLGVLLGLGRLAFSGRDRRPGMSAEDAALASPGGEPSMQMEPPDGLLPGQIGTLIDEAAHPLDVTATIVHLAVRGYLQIREIPEEGLFSRQDWELRKTEGKDMKGLRPYERILLQKLFDDGTEVRLSDLRFEFADRLKRVQDALYDDAMAQGWFVARPDRVRRRWKVIGVAALVLSIAAQAALAAFTHFGLLGIPLVLGSLLLLIGARWMPHRTAKGAAVLRRAEGFRRFIHESERERARFAENQNWFSEYLPYAIVFGATDKWARAFAGLDDEVSRYSGWYYGSGPFRTSTFCSSMDDFAVTTSGTLVSAPSGSSGFSGGSAGGGGGGGGGGSW